MFLYFLTYSTTYTHTHTKKTNLTTKLFFFIFKNYRAVVGNFCANFIENGIFCLSTIYKLHCKQRLTFFLVALCFFSHSLYHQSYYVCKQVFPRMQCFVVEVAHLGKRVRILWSKKLKHKINMNDKVYTKLFKI